MTVRERALQKQLKEQHAALEVLQQRADSSVNFLNRSLDELEAEKEKLVDELKVAGQARDFDQERIASLTEQVISLSLDKQKLLDERTESREKTQQTERALQGALISVEDIQLEKKSLELQLVDERERTMDALRALAAAENLRLEMSSQIGEQKETVQMLETRLQEADARERSLQLTVQSANATIMEVGQDHIGVEMSIGVADVQERKHTTSEQALSSTADDDVLDNTEVSIRRTLSVRTSRIFRVARTMKRSLSGTKDAPAPRHVRTSQTKITQQPDTNPSFGRDSSAPSLMLSEKSQNAIPETRIPALKELSMTTLSSTKATTSTSRRTKRSHRKLVYSALRPFTSTSSSIDDGNKENSFISESKSNSILPRRYVEIDLIPRTMSCNITDTTRSMRSFKRSPLTPLKVTR